MRLVWVSRFTLVLGYHILVSLRYFELLQLVRHPHLSELPLVDVNSSGPATPPVPAILHYRAERKLSETGLKLLTHQHADEVATVPRYWNDTMPAKNADLHGNAPDKCEIALLLIDVINDLEFPEGDEMLPHALLAAQRIHELKLAACELRIPTVYVNDNFGRWRSDFQAQVDHCLKDNVRGEPIVRLLKPRDEDYFVLKPKHSGFFSTTLDMLLEYLGARTLILTGVATNVCVLFTANDAYMRDYHLYVPADCVAANTKAENDYALEQMQKILKADTTPATDLVDELRRLITRAGNTTPQNYSSGPRALRAAGA